MKFRFIFLVSILVLSLSIVSATGTTAIGGTIKYKDSGNAVVGAFVNVTCNGFSDNGTTDGTGTYGVDFSILNCNESHNYSIFASKGEYSGNDEDRIIDGILLFGDLIVAGADLDIEKNIGNTTITGTIYNSTNDVIENASVTVTCNGINANVTLSNVNGSYSVNFSESVCNSSHVFSVFAEKGEYNGTNESLNVINGTVANVVIKKAEAVTPPVPATPSSSGGGSGGNTQYICEEWSECIDGLQTKVCNNNSITSRSCEMEEEVEELDTGEIFESKVPEDVTSPGFFSTITGAVIGGGMVAWGALTAFILLVIGGFGFVMFRRNKKSKK